MKKNKGATVALVICFVLMIAVLGLTSMERFEKQTETERPHTEEKSLAKVQPETIELDEFAADANQEEEDASAVDSDEVEAKLEADPVTDSVVESVAEQTSSTAEPIFTESEKLLWPIEGNVILNYSMDQTVYFPTLEQYKYNPALIISGEVGSPVIAAADGRVLSITEEAQTGTSLVMNLGSGYEACYGQLSEIRVAEGEWILEGTVLGYVSEPTKYYSVEGPNLYFAMRSNGQAINPLEYLE